MDSESYNAEAINARHRELYEKLANYCDNESQAKLGVERMCNALKHISKKPMTPHSRLMAGKLRSSIKGYREVLISARERQRQIQEMLQALVQDPSSHGVAGGVPPAQEQVPQPQISTHYNVDSQTGSGIPQISPDQMTPSIQQHVDAATTQSPQQEGEGPFSAPSSDRPQGQSMETNASTEQFTAQTTPSPDVDDEMNGAGEISPSQVASSAPSSDHWQPQGQTSASTEKFTVPSPDVDDEMNGNGEISPSQSTSTTSEPQHGNGKSSSMHVDNMSQSQATPSAQQDADATTTAQSPQQEGGNSSPAPSSVNDRSQDQRMETDASTEQHTVHHENLPREPGSYPNQAADYQVPIPPTFPNIGVPPSPAPTNQDAFLVSLSQLLIRGNRDVLNKISDLTTVLLNGSVPLGGPSPASAPYTYDGDHEMDEGCDSSGPFFQKRKPHQRTKKNALDKALSKNVRDYLEEKGVRVKPKAPLPPCAEAHQVSAFESNSHPGPSSDCIVLDWLNPFSRKWNQQALSFLARGLLEKIRAGDCVGVPKDVDIDEATILATCKASLGNTHRRFRLAIPRGTENPLQAAERALQKQKDDARAGRRLGRRHGIYVRRNETIQEQRELSQTSEVRASAWQAMQSVHDMMTPDGMSTDETDSDYENPRRVRRVRRHWLADEVSEIYRTVDSHYSSFYLAGNPKPGNKPIMREYAASRTSYRPAVPGLPVNFYNSMFIASLKEYQRRNLQVAPPMNLPAIGPHA